MAAQLHLRNDLFEMNVIIGNKMYLYLSINQEYRITMLA